jgi:hypothetical protein
MPLQSAEFFRNASAIESGIRRAAEQGYAFVGAAVTPAALEALEAEVDGLNLKLGDHVKEPIKQGTPSEITQLHERAYLPIDDPLVPVAARLTDALAAQTVRVRDVYPELAGWRTNEAGYQRYRGDADHISKHRDRLNDKLLAATITILGAARIGIYQALGEVGDYTNTRRITSFAACRGTIMFLRAKGLGTGEQVIHDVSPPLKGSRLILNLRMRPEDDVLPPPSETT